MNQKDRVVKYLSIILFFKSICLCFLSPSPSVCLFRDPDPISLFMSLFCTRLTVTRSLPTPAYLCLYLSLLTLTHDIVVPSFDIDGGASGSDVIKFHVVIFGFEFLGTADVIARTLKRRRLAVLLGTRRTRTSASVEG